MSEPDREEKHYHWDQGHAYVVEGGKSLILINGGAAIGVMTFARNSHLSVSGLLVVAIGLFALGAFSGPSCSCWPIWQSLDTATETGKLANGCIIRPTLRPSVRPWFSPL
jgi:hypothetical protein